MLTSNKNKITLLLLFYLSIVLFFLGSFLPMFSFKKFFIFEDSFSLISGIWQLFINGEYLLFFILFSFSFIAPIYKFILTFFILREKGSTKKFLKQLLLIGKWSMADVFIISILAVVIKLSTIFSIEIHSGFYVFFTAIIFSVILNHFLFKKYTIIDEKIS